MYMFVHIHTIVTHVYVSKFSTGFQGGRSLFKKDYNRCMLQTYLSKSIISSIIYEIRAMITILKRLHSYNLAPNSVSCTFHTITPKWQ